MELPLTDFRRRLWELAKNQFPGEYVGDIDVLARIDPKERWTWLRTTFLEKAHQNGGRRFNGLYDREDQRDSAIRKLKAEIAVLREKVAETRTEGLEIPTRTRWSFPSFTSS